MFAYAKHYYGGREKLEESRSEKEPTNLYWHYF